jgi:hypothetical protein
MMKMEEIKTRSLIEITSTYEMNQLHGNGILLIC